MQTPLVIIESPFAGNRERNLTYLAACVRDSIARGERPFASHGFYPQFLNDDDPAERQLGIEFGYAFWHDALCIAFYTDLGWSKGMLTARARVIKEAHLQWCERSIAK